MTALHSLEDISALKETWQIECKLALGRYGEGTLPEDVWETYSAFANTNGGDIFLGLRELGPGNYELAGIPNPQRVVDEFIAGLNDSGRVSANVLCVDSIGIVVIDGRSIVHINVPRAPVYLRPVYIGNDPLTGTYVRSGDADQRLDPDRVRRIQAKVRGQLISKS
jgi:ATP-dependent DNA helicase RecG